MHGSRRQIAVVLAALFNVGLNALAGAGVLFDAQTGAISDAHPTGLTPAGWAFSIWSVIFVGALVFAAWQAMPDRRGKRYDRLGAPFVAANVLNGVWQIPWTLERFGLSALVIVGILASLVWLYVRLDAMGLRGAERWALGIPVSLFLAWLTVATPLNATIWLQSLGWTSLSPLWPAGLALAVVGIGLSFLLRTGDVAAALVFLWAYAAIFVAHTDNTALVAVLAVGSLAIAAAAVVGARTYSPWPTTQTTPT